MSDWKSSIPLESQESEGTREEEEVLSQPSIARSEGMLDAETRELFGQNPVEEIGTEAAILADQASVLSTTRSIPELFCDLKDGLLQAVRRLFCRIFPKII